jgi:hypothetical protein
MGDAERLFKQAGATVFERSFGPLTVAFQAALPRAAATAVLEKLPLLDYQASWTLLPESPESGKRP